jgi:hypothetical protein
VGRRLGRCLLRLRLWCGSGCDRIRNQLRLLREIRGLVPGLERSLLGLFRSELRLWLGFGLVRARSRPRLPREKENCGFVLGLVWVRAPECLLQDLRGHWISQRMMPDLELFGLCHLVWKAPLFVLFWRPAAAAEQSSRLQLQLQEVGSPSAYFHHGHASVARAWQQVDPSK